MKTLLLTSSLLFCNLGWANQVITCQMKSRGNQAEIILTIVNQLVEMSLGGEVLESCVRDKSNRYSLLIRCGEDEDSTYFGIKGTSGRVYGDFGNFAELKQCH